MLILPIKKKWFDKLFPYNIHVNTNTNELWYLGDRTPAQEIIFRNGYQPDSLKIKCNCKLRIGQGKEEWGAEKRKRVLCIRNIGGAKWKLK